MKWNSMREGNINYMAYSNSTEEETTQELKLIDYLNPNTATWPYRIICSTVLLHIHGPGSEI